MSAAAYADLAEPETSGAAEARNIVADAILAEGSGYRNLAENVRSGGVPNSWIRFALRAAEMAVRRHPL